jgi:hypothetical protein
LYETLERNRISRFLKQRAQAISNYLTWSRNVKLCLSKNQMVKRILSDKEQEKSYTHERQIAAQAFNLHVEKRGGRDTEGFPWSHYGGCRWTDDGPNETFGNSVCWPCRRN